MSPQPVPPAALEILHEDNHLLVVNKPSGIPTMGALPDEPSLWQMAKEYLKEKYHKPGNVYLGVVSRLDALVSGAIVFARTSKAAARLNEQFRNSSVEKTYWAVVEGVGLSSTGTCQDWLLKDDAAHRVRAVAGSRPGAQRATLSFRRLRELSDATWLEIALESGRKHQIRVQMSHRGHPILGDKKYGAANRFAVGIALHSRRLALAHPVTKEPLEWTAPLGRGWKEIGVVG